MFKPLITNIIKVCLVLVCLASRPQTAYSQENWKLATQQDGIKIYLKDAIDSEIKMMKVACEIPATFEAVLSLLLDISASEKWIPQTKTWHYLRQISPMECYYYYELRMPWPVTNRDCVVHIKATQNPGSKMVTMDAEAVAGMVPEKQGIVRVNESKVKWLLYPLKNQHTFLVYEIFTNPGGNIPAWVVNYFSKGAAIDIIKKMTGLVQQAPYRDARLAFINR